MGPHSLSLVLPAWTVLAEGYAGKTRPQLEHVVYPEGTVARSCQPNALLEAEQAVTLFKAVSKFLISPGASGQLGFGEANQVKDKAL